MLPNDTTLLPQSSAKRCRKCGETKPLTDFWLDGKSKDGHACTCRFCRGAKDKYRLRDSADVYPGPGLKRCLTCNQAKPLAEFSSDKTRGDGKQVRCKDCDRVKRTKYDNAHSEQKRERIQQWWKANPERKKKYGKAWRAAHPGYMTEWLVKNPAMLHKVRRMQAAWMRANPDRMRAHRSNRRARLSNAFIETVSLDIVFDRDNGICGICGQPVIRDKATLDHVIPLARGGGHSYANIQLAHGACNSRKGTKLNYRLTPRL